MDLVLQNSTLLLSKALALDAETLLASKTADELLLSIRQQLSLELPANPWTIQYADIHTAAFAAKNTAEYQLRQEQYGVVSSLTDDVGVIRYVRNLLMIRLLQLACLRRYESVEQAAAVKVRIRAQVEAINLSSSDAMYLALRDLKTLLIEAIEQQEETLPHVMYIQRKKSLPALLIAYQLYETIDRETDIVTRNGIRHPGFCPVASDIEVLSQ